MSATALWFGPDERRLFGWVHCHDDGKDRPAVLLCPPLARELNSATFSYRLLAEALERKGFLAIRFDYDGTGDSAGSHQDPDRVESWVRSIQSAGDLARQCGASSVSLVGLRMGGLLADEAANRMDVEALVLWDPCKEGRSFVRQQQAIQLLATSDPENSESAVEIPGFVVDPDTLDDLSGLKLLRSAGARSLRTLILHR